MSTDENFRNAFFEDLSRIRDQNPRQGGNPLSFIEKLGAVKVPVQFFEPDPLSSHQEYYYNSRQNVLYKRKLIGPTRAVWLTVATI